MLHLNRLVDDAVERARSTEWLSVEGMRRTAQPDGYLRYFCLGGVPMWLAVNFKYWSLYRETPIWLGFQDGALGENWELPDNIYQRLAPLRKAPQDTLKRRSPSRSCCQPESSTKRF